MTLKEFVVTTLRLPATILGGLSTLILGDYDRDEHGVAKKQGVFRGILGLTLDLVKYIGRNITNFLVDHKDAIATSFWLSLLAAGAAAAVVAFWPAALAAVTGFTIAGYSIGAFFTGFTAQVAATAGVAAVLTSAAVYSVATVANVCKFIYGCCCGPDSDDDLPMQEQPESSQKHSGNSSIAAMSKMGGKRPQDPRTHASPAYEYASLYNNEEPTAEEELAPAAPSAAAYR